jgi:hypothetical protein
MAFLVVNSLMQVTLISAYLQIVNLGVNVRVISRLECKIKLNCIFSFIKVEDISLVSQTTEPSYKYLSIYDS